MGDVISIVPVFVVQVGCVSVVFGAAGAPGGGSIVAVAVELQPPNDTVNIYVPGMSPGKEVSAEKFTPSML